MGGCWDGRKGQCSMFGANGTATPDGHLLQLRALDWDVDGMHISLLINAVPGTLLHSDAGPFKNYPQITVYHPNAGSGYGFANVGWTGWIGSITGKRLHS